MPHEATYDPETGSLYLRSSREKVARSVNLANGLVIDLDENDSVVGMEIVDPTVDQLVLHQTWIDETPGQS